MNFTPQHGGTTKRTAGSWTGLLGFHIFKDLSQPDRIADPAEAMDR